MKRQDVLRKLAEAGYTFREGKRHTKGYDADGNYRTAVSRQTEIQEATVREIEKQTGVSLR